MLSVDASDGVLIRCRLVGKFIVRGKEDYTLKKITEILARDVEDRGVEGTVLEMLFSGMASKTGEINLTRLTREFLLGIFAATHTSYTALTTTLVELATHSEVQEVLRKEIADCIEKHGWTLPALQDMVKLDSFIKESMRLRPLSHMSFFRVMRQPHTFSDGTRVQPGDHVCALAGPRLTDARIFDEPDAFQPWRWEKLKEAGREGTEFTDVRGEEWMIFGTGKHACPGRFFASAILKVALGGLLVGWRVQMEGRKGRPANKTFEEVLMPLQGEETRVRFIRLE